MSNENESKKLTLGSLFDGIAGFPYAAERFGIETKWTSEIEPAPSEISARHFPNAKQLGDVTKINGAEIEPVDIISFGSPCFPAGTLIKTSAGIKNIEDIQIGDKVFTHKKRWRKVIDFGVSLSGIITLLDENGKMLKCTPDHPIYTISDSGEEEWVQAKDMKNRKWAICPLDTSEGNAEFKWAKVIAIILPPMDYRFPEREDRTVVYNMTVEEDNSYTADFVVVHNCQDMSVAGNRAGLDGNRSSLFHEAIRIIREMRNKTNGEYPTYAIWENVPGAFSSNKGEDFRRVLEEITETEIPVPQNGKWAENGMVELPDRSVAWRTFDAQYWGVPQRRRRIYLVADFGGQRAAEILFKPESVSGDITQSGETRQGTSTVAESGT